MPQDDYNIINDSGANVRTDLNNQFLATVQHNSGATEPGTMFAHQIWADSSPSGYSIFQVRNAANGAWAPTFDDEGRWKGALGTASEPSITFKGDVNTGMYWVTANTLGFSTDGTLAMKIDSSQDVTLAGNFISPITIHTGGSNSLTPNTSADDLVVTTLDHAGITIIAGEAARNSSIFFADQETLDDDAGRIVYENQTAEFQFWTPSSEIVNINSTGLVLRVGKNLRLAGGAIIYTPATITTDTTPTAANRHTIIIGAWIAANDITDFDNETEGQELRIIGGDSDCNVVDGAPIQLVGNVTWNAAAGAILDLVSVSGVWIEANRSDAS